MTSRAERWDAIVVGSGMGGLTAAAYLAAAGRRTLVLEAWQVVGGCTHVFRHRGFEFDVGVHYLGDCGPEGAIPTMLRGVGLDGRIQFLPMDRDGFDTIVYPDVTVKVPAGWDNYLHNLVAAFPGDETGLRRFIGVMRALGEATDRLVTPSSNWRIPGMVVRAGPSARWAMQPLARLLDACRLSVGARAVLTAQASYLTSPHRAATLVHAAFLHNYIRDGAYFPAGGGQVLAAHLASVVTAHGGQVRTRARVSRIVVQSNRVTGVELTSGERIAADVVVSNADIKRTLLELVGPDHVPSRLLRRTENYRMSVPLVNLYIALDVDLRDQIPNTNYFSCPVTEPSEVVFDMGQRAGEMSEPEIDDYLSRVPAYVTFQSIKDPDNDMIAPQGYTNLEIMSGAPSDYRFWGVETGPYAGGRYRRRPDYLYRKEQYTDALLDRGAAVVPGVARQTG